MKRTIFQVVVAICVIVFVVGFWLHRYHKKNQSIETGIRSASLYTSAEIEQGDHRLIHIYGHSIARGVIFYKCEDEIDHPNPLNRIQDIANMLLIENDIAPKKLRVRYAGSQNVEQMRTELASGIIKDGDTIVFEDAGQHENNISLRRQKFFDIKQVIVKSGHKVRLILTTMFDYKPNPLEYPNSEYDVLIGSSGLTMNDIVRSVSSDGSCSLLDWNREMDLAMKSVIQRFGVSLVYPDRVHPNAYGKILLAASLLNHIGIPINKYNSIKDAYHKLLADCYRRAGFNKSLDSKQADKLIDFLINFPSGKAKVK